jgi:hypothetical protein
LEFGRPRNKIITEIDTETGGGSTGIGTTFPIGVRVSDERGRRRRYNVSTKIKSSFNIANYSFYKMKVSGARGMHEQA